MGIDRRVIAVVDASDDHIGLAWAQFCQSHLHTVDRCAVARPYLYAIVILPQMEPQRCRGREGTRETATSLVRGTDDDITKFRHHLHQLPDTLCLIAVIIGNK